jgi:Cft2 family RNA processing exonuclease
VKGIKKLFLVHGEDEPENKFKEALIENGFNDTYIPSPNETVEIKF